MTDSKPFSCGHAGCDMTFTNEDHLFVHKHKHELKPLHFDFHSSSPKVFTFSDQTPTPTKFFRIEEGHLFEEISTSSPGNPFDDQFRKAVTKPVSKLSSETLPAPSSEDVAKEKDDDREDTEDTVSKSRANSGEDGADEPLPSRVSYVKTTRSNSSNSMETFGNDVDVIVEEEIREETVVSSTPPSDESLSSARSTPVVEKTAMFFLRFPGQEGLVPVKLSDAVISASIDDGEEEKEPDHKEITNGTIPRSDQNLAKLVNCHFLPRGVSGDKELRASDRTETNNSPNRLASTASAGEVTEDDFSYSRRRQSPENDDDDDDDGDDFGAKRQRLLERNRAAAFRSRKKRKSWIAELEKNCSHLADLNENLQLEMDALKKELKSVKQLLMEHVTAECHVAKIQETRGRLPSDLARSQIVRIKDFESARPPVGFLFSNYCTSTV